jgi:hypothetical protein
MEQARRIRAAIGLPGPSRCESSGGREPTSRQVSVRASPVLRLGTDL